MLVQICWLLSLPSIVTSTIYPIYNTSVSTTTTIESTSTTISTYQPTLTPTNSPTIGPLLTPPTFYLATYPDTRGPPDFYLKLFDDPLPYNPLNRDYAIGHGFQNTTGAANFTLHDNGTLQCNSDFGPLYASYPKGVVNDYTLEFAAPSSLDRWGLVAVNCSNGIEQASFDCVAPGGVKVPYYDEEDNIFVLGTIGNSPNFIGVVPT